MKAQLNLSETVNRINEFEGGNLTIQKYVELFSHLVANGQAWTLQGMYGRTAMNLIENNIIEKDGAITQEAIDEYWGKPELMLYNE